MKPKTKIIATIGPASLPYAICIRMVKAGVDYIRINSKYGDEGQYAEVLKNLGKISTGSVEVIFDIVEQEKLEYARKNNITKIALSFAETKEQIQSVRKAVLGAFVISKIESKKGVLNFDQILEASDGIMVARGDLGEAHELWEVPPLQKELSAKTIKKAKFLVTATEMLLSMTKNSQPTRAEVSDVANAVFEGTSAVMLSEETATGKYPVESVAIMRKIVLEAEKYMNSKKAISPGA